MPDTQEPDEGKQEAKLPDGGVAQPPATPPQQPPAPPNAAQPNNDQEPPNPILVRLIGGEDLKPFEEQTLAISRETLEISRRTYWVAIFAFGAALAAALFVGSQVKVMSYQTQIMASQSEGANAGALLDEMNTRKQLDIAQKQAVSLQGQVDTIRHNFIKEQQPFLWFTNDPSQIIWDTGSNRPSWTSRYTNYGKSPARYLIFRALEIGPDAMSKAQSVEFPLPKNAKGFNTLPQGKFDFLTAFSGDPQAIFDEAMKHDGWIVMVGTFLYYDLSGNFYVTDFCALHNSNGSLGGCTYKHKTQRKRAKNPN